MNATREHGAATRTGRSARSDVQWLDVAAVADVTIVSAGRRIPRVANFWSADTPGEQTIEIRFHRPTAVRRLRVVSLEVEQSRTQEMTIWASLDRGERHREVVRQRFDFNPNSATEEIEEYALQLEGVSVLQLRIIPSIDGRRAVARVSELRVASA